MTTYAQQIAEAAIEAAAKKCDNAGWSKEPAELAEQIRSLDLDAIIASVPITNEQPEAAQDDLNKATDRVVIANATGNPDLYHDAVAALLKVVRQAAKRDALTQARELTDAVPVRLDFLREVLDHMERDWQQIDQEWGPTDGGIEAEIQRGNQPTIAKLRALLSASKGER